jgi:hypothetical protein
VRRHSKQHRLEQPKTSLCSSFTHIYYFTSNLTAALLPVAEKRKGSQV